MGVSFEKFTFTKSTSTSVPVSQEVNLSGAFQPKALILWTNATTGTTFQEHMHVSYGFSDGTNDAVVATESKDNNNSAAYMNVLRNDSIISILDISEVELCRASVTSFDADGFTLSWTVNGVGNPAAIVHGIAIGGTDITNVKVEFDTTGTTATGNKAYTGAGFQPDFMLQLADWDAYNATSTVSNNVIIGCAKSTTKRWCVDVETEGGAAMDTWSYQRDTKCMVMLDQNGAVDEEADFVSFDTDGYTLNWTNAPGFTTDAIATLLIKGGQWDAGTVVQRDNTGAQAITTSGIDTHKGAFFVTHGQVISTAGTAQAHSRLSIGGADGTRQGYTTHHDTDASAASIISKIQNTDGIARVITANATATSSTTQAQADFTSFSANAININWSVADTTDRVVSWWAVGEAVTGTTFNRSPSADSVTVADSSLTRILSAARVPSADSITVTAGTATRATQAFRTVSPDTTTVADSSVTGVKTVVRATSADSTIVADSSTTRILSAVRAPTPETVTPSDSSLTRILSASRTISPDTTTVADSSVTGVKMIIRAPTADDTTVTDSSTTRILSAVRVPTPETVTPSDSSLTRTLSASRTVSPDTTVVADSSTTQMITRTRAPTADDTIVADSSLTRILSVLRAPALETVTPSDSSLTRMLSASRMVQKNVYDDFNAGTYSFTEGGTSPNGLWDNLFLGGTGSSSGVRFASSINSNVMWLTPQVSTTEFETHATENKSVNTWANFDATFRMRTVAQLRQNFPPNTWETAWVIFRYTDDWHHYYFTLKTNGPEFGRKDYFPHVEEQIFLATPGTPTCTIGQWYTVRIRAIRNHFQIWIDGSLVIDMVDDGSVGFDSQTSGLPPPPTAALYGPGTFNPYNEDAEVEFDDIWIGESDFVATSENVSGGKLFGRDVSIDSITVTDSSLTRILSAVRAPSADSTTVLDSSITRMMSLLRIPTTDTTNISEDVTGQWTQGVQTYERSPTAEDVTIADSSLTRLLSASRQPSTDDVITGENLARILSAIRSPSLDSITVADVSVTKSETRERIPTTEDVTVTDASLLRLLSATRTPSTEVTSVSDASILRMLSALRIPTTESVTTSEDIQRLITQPGQFNRSPATENITVGENLTRALQLFRVLAADTTIISENLSGGKVIVRIPSADSVTVVDSSLTRLLQKTRAPTTENITVAEASLSRLLQLIRVPSTDTTTITENSLTRSVIIPRVPSTDSVTVTAGIATRIVSLTRDVQDTTNVIESSLVRLLLAQRSPSQDTVTVSELQSLISHSRSLQDTITVTEPILQRIVTSIRSLGPEFVDISEEVFFQTWHRFVFDSVIVAESLFSERQLLSGPITYATPDEVRPLLGNLGSQRTDVQIQLAIDSAYDEINRKTSRIPPGDWKDTDADFSIIKKLTRLKAALEMSIGIKDFEDREWIQKEIDEMFAILEEHDTGGAQSNDVVISSEDETYALNPQGIIWSVRYQNLKKSSRGENDTTINTDT